MGCIGACLHRIRRRMRLERFRELGRQYPVVCFLLLVLLLSTVLLNRSSGSVPSHDASPQAPAAQHLRAFLCPGRYIHIIMVFWSFLAGVVTFYCSLGPESLLPNIFVSIRPRTRVGPGGTNNSYVAFKAYGITYE